MVQAAETTAATWPNDIGSRARFQVADCSEPFLLDDGPFDVVFAAFLHNYAADAATMTRMWRNIHDNLKPGGRFVGIMPYLDLDMDIPLDDRYGVTVKAIGIVENGWKCRLTAFCEPENIEFEMYHLHKYVYENTASEAGLTGISWHVHVLPKDERRTNGFWDVYNERPHIEIVTAHRSQ